MFSLLSAIEIREHGYVSKVCTFVSVFTSLTGAHHKYGAVKRY